MNREMTKIEYVTRWIRWRLRAYILSWIYLITSIISVVSFGFYWPNWNMYFIVWWDVKEINWMKRKGLIS